MREKRGVGEKCVLDEIAEFSGVEEDPAVGDDLARGGGGLCVAELESDKRGGVVGGEGDEGGGVIDDGGLAATERREGGEKGEDVGMDKVEQTEVEFVEVDGGVRGLHGRGVDEVVIGVGGGGETEIAARVRGEFAERTGDGLNGKKERGKRERGKKREKKGGELRGRREVKEGGVEEEREIARAAADEREKEKALNRRVCGEVCEGILQERERGVGENSGGWAMSQRESKRTGSRAGSSPAPAASPRGWRPPHATPYRRRPPAHVAAAAGWLRLTRLSRLHSLRRTSPHSRSDTPRPWPPRPSETTPRTAPGVASAPPPSPAAVSDTPPRTRTASRPRRGSPASPRPGAVRVPPHFQTTAPALAGSARRRRQTRRRRRRRD